MIPKDCKRLADVDFPIAGAFHRTGFETRLVAEDAAKTPGAHSATQGATQSATQSTDPVERLLTCLARGEMSAGELRSALRIKHRPTFRANYLHPALATGWIEYTLPDKPSSRLQKYRLTPAGDKALKERGGEDVK